MPKQELASQNIPLFYELVEPHFQRSRRLHWQFERLASHDVSEHQRLLQEIEQAEHNVWQAIALATVDINPEMISVVSKKAPMSLSEPDKKWISQCLQEGKMPLMDDDQTTPIRFMESR